MEQSNKIWVVFYFIFQYLVLPSCTKNEISNPSLDSEIKFSGVLSTLKKEHPRLILPDIHELKTLSNTDTKLERYVADVVAQADKDILESPIEHVLIGYYMLNQSRECLKRVYNLAFAYRWTGNAKYLNSAISNMKTVCSFEDWNPSHFLDVAEMSHAIAIGYDWLYNDMDQPARDQIKYGLINLGLNEGKKAYSKNSWWVKDKYNWNMVCNSSMLIGALSVAETDTAIAKYIIEKAIENLPYALESYGTDGVWDEGLNYWEYATGYTAYGLSALQTALGKDFELTQFPGMDLTGYFPMYSAGPMGYTLNYADAGEKTKLYVPHPAMWLANVYNNNHFSDFVIDQLKTQRANINDVIWFRPYANTADQRGLDKYFDGKVALYFSRSSWTDTNALWVGIKAGYNKFSHAHLDLGNFELDAMGVRWARDLGSDDYNLPGYFSTKRYTYYRLQSISHNVPVLNNQNQREDATSKFLKHAEGIAEPFSVIDFTEAYKDFASKAYRGLKVVNNRKSVLIQDEFLLTKTAEITWGMTTDATIQIINSKNAELTLSGKKLAVKILSPENAVFSSESAQQDKPQKENIGVSRLLAKTPSIIGNVTISILLLPQWSGTANEISMDVLPLSEWK